MNTTDPIADMLTRIRNANSAKFKTVDMFPNKQKSRFQARFSSLLKSRLSSKPFIASLLQFYPTSSS